MEVIKEQVEKLVTDEKFGPAIQSEYKKKITEQVLENEIRFLKQIHEASDDATSFTSGVKNWDPVLIRMVRRATPQLMAFDLAGVQPMSGPTGSIFAMRSRYNTQTGDEALFGEANSAFSGTGTQAGDTSGFAANEFGSGDPTASTSHGTGMALTDAENLGNTSGSAWKEMTFSVERVDVSAVSRKLKASFSRELQQDLRNIHGLDAETELANILSTEIAAEQDRELLRTINISAVIGAGDATVPGNFNLEADSDGRWLVEKFKGLIFQIELEANAVAIATRRGKANAIICSANVASALNMAGVLQYNPQMAANLNVDVTSSTFCGILLGRYKVYADPYATVDYVTVAYVGTNAWDAGVYFCPYIPLEMVRTVTEGSFQPRIGFATRYAIAANPFMSNNADGTTKSGKGLGQGENGYFRKFRVSNIATSK